MDDDMAPGPGTHFGDPGPHLPSADDTDSFDCHAIDGRDCSPPRIGAPLGTKG